MTLAIRADGISKSYRIGTRARYGRLTESLTRTLTHPFHRDGDAADLVWALRDLDLEVHKGEVLGVIGRNGAGKTTLLKILCRVTTPTAGEAEVWGRVGTFLEVGTGFHPELTGRENVYLNGAILGLRKAEIERKFDAIVEFSEVERFLDTPVKFYSSGMQMRLAFAVAAHLEPDILFVDEVLAVGDFRFQQKCLETMRNVGETGNTVLMVSHDLGAIRTFCTSCIWLDQGQIVQEGPVEECVQAFLASGSASDNSLDVDVSGSDRPAGQGTEFRFERVTLRTPEHDDALRYGEAMVIELRFNVRETVRAVSLGFSVHSTGGTWVLQCLNTHCGEAYEVIEPGRYLVEAVIEDNVLVDGRYVLSVGARGLTEGLDWVRDVLEFEVTEAARASWWLDPGRAGVVRLASRFKPPVHAPANDADEPPSPC